MSRTHQAFLSLSPLSTLKIACRLQQTPLTPPEMISTPLEKKPESVENPGYNSLDLKTATLPLEEQSKRALTTP